MNPAKIKRMLEIYRKIDSPLYVYDLGTIKTKYSLLSNNLPKNFRILYALKANPNIEIANFFKELGAGIDIASGGELNIAIKAEYNVEDISFAGPGKTEEELKNAVKNNTGIINVESAKELLLIDKIAKKLNQKANVGIRINPQKELKLSGIRMGGGPKQFGIDEEQLPYFFEKLNKLKNVIFRGIHIFSGSQILDYKIILESFENILKIAFKIQKKHNQTLSIINLGGGFGIPYFEREAELDIKNFGTGLKKIWNKYKVDTKFPNTRFFVESGRYLIGDGGFYLTKVLYKKKSRGINYIVTDGGMNHHLAASGNLGSLIRKNYKIKILNKLDQKPSEKVTIVGPLCTPLDLLAKDIILPKTEEGDIVCIFNSGAYGYSSSPLEFLSHPKPKEVIIK